MRVTSQLALQTTKFFHSLFNVRLSSPTLKKVPPPLTSAQSVKEMREDNSGKQTNNLKLSCPLHWYPSGNWTVLLVAYEILHKIA